MATKTYDKELLLCLTLAYFAKYPNVHDKDHELRFTEMFSVRTFGKPYPGIAVKGTFTTNASLTAVRDALKNDPKKKTQLTLNTDVAKRVGVLRRDLGTHLSRGFNYEFLLQNFGATETPTGLFSSHPSVLKVYRQIRNLIQSNIISAAELGQYEFLDQNDPFMDVVKNQCLAKLAPLFGIASGNSQELLSPVDIFIVKKTAKTQIMNTFKKFIITPPAITVLGNAVTRTNTYRTLMQQFMKARVLFGVSHKLPTTVSGALRPKIVGATSYGDTPQAIKQYNEFIDPFGQLLGAIITNPSDMNSIIDQALTIEFENFDLSEHKGSWTMPIRFHYDRVFPKYNIETTHLPKSVRFLLLNWQDAGFNGKWEIDARSGTWVGGAGAATSFRLFDQYDTTIVGDIVKRRVSVLQRMVGNPLSLTPTQTSAYRTVLESLSRPVPIRPDTAFKTAVDAMFVALDRPQRHDALTHAIVEDLLRDLPATYRYDKVDPKFSDSHMIHAQLAFFMFRGGKQHQLNLKKRIFLSVYGLVTKSAYKIFTTNGINEHEVKSMFTKKFTTKLGEKLIAEFHVAPHLVIG